MTGKSSFRETRGDCLDDRGRGAGAEGMHYYAPMFGTIFTGRPLNDLTSLRISYFHYIYLMYEATLVANYILKLDRGEGIKSTNIRLQRLSYFTYGLYLAKYGKPFYFEKVQAKPFGTFVPSVWHEWAFCGNSPILTSAMVGGRLDEETREFVKEVWGYLKDYSDRELVELSHSAGSPLLAHWEKNGKERTMDMDDEVIEEYFKTFLVE